MHEGPGTPPFLAHLLRDVHGPPDPTAVHAGLVGWQWTRMPHLRPVTLCICICWMSYNTLTEFLANFLKSKSISLKKQHF